MGKNKSSSTSLSPQRHKKSKKNKSKKDVKKEKKVKKCKEKRRSKTVHFSSPALGNGFGSSSNHQNTDGTIESNDVFGPPLPPHLLRSALEKPIIGPQMPSNLLKTFENNAVENASSSGADDDDDGIVFGPLPPTSDFHEASMTASQLDLEKRALELKIAAIDGVPVKDVDQIEREEWMLELPEVGLRTGVAAALSNIKRKFHHGREKPDFSDRSVWTKTPQSDTKITKRSLDSRTVAETLRNKAQEMYDQQRDKDQGRLAKKYEKQHKRDESLVQIHQKKLREKEREEKLAGSNKAERRPFSRDVDLKLIKIDRNQTKSIVDKAKILDTKFASGKTKYL